MRESSFNANMHTVCKAHWDGNDSGCSKCPIRKECHSGPTARLTYEELDLWRERVNKAADAAIDQARAEGGEKTNG